MADISADDYSEHEISNLISAGVGGRWRGDRQ
jgi:hypothetical protein